MAYNQHHRPIDTRKDGAKPEYNEVILHIQECQNLRAADRKFFGLGSKSTSDPYVIIKDVKGLIGSDRRTRTKYKNLNPKFDDPPFALHINYKCTRIKLLVKDEDDNSPDDYLGKLNIPINSFNSVHPDASNFRTIERSFPLVHGASSKWSNCRGKSLGSIKVRMSVRFNIPIAHPNMVIPLEDSKINIGLGWDFGKKRRPIDLDASVAAVDHNNQLVDYCAFSRLQAFGGVMRHSGDDRSGEGGGDDETISTDLMHQVYSNVDRLLIFINAYSQGDDLSKVDNAYVRISVPGPKGPRTITFYSLFRSAPRVNGLLFGQILRIGSTWNFVSICQPAEGRTMKQSLVKGIQLATQQRMQYLPATMAHMVQLPSNLHIGQQYEVTVQGQSVPVTVPEQYRGAQMQMQIDIPQMSAAQAGAQLLHGAVGVRSSEAVPVPQHSRQAPPVVQAVPVPAAAPQGGSVPHGSPRHLNGTERWKAWSIDDLSNFLTDIGLAHVVPLFKENGVDGQFLASLSDEDLCSDLGLKPLQVRKIRQKLGEHA